VDVNSHIFTVTNPGLSVIQYLNSVNRLPANSPSSFTVVRSVNWNDPNYLQDNQPATIGVAITNATHFDYEGQNGYTGFP